MGEYLVFCGVWLGCCVIAWQINVNRIESNRSLLAISDELAKLRQLEETRDKAKADRRRRKI